MMQTKIYSNLLTVTLIFLNTESFAQEAISPNSQAQQKMTMSKGKLIEACSKTYSGSSNQVEDCITCAKNASDINSRRFINCMNSFETINERKTGQTGLDEILNNTPNCIKGIKAFGC